MRRALIVAFLGAFLMAGCAWFTVKVPDPSPKPKPVATAPEDKQIKDEDKSIEDLEKEIIGLDKDIQTSKDHTKDLEKSKSGKEKVLEAKKTARMQFWIRFAAWGFLVLAIAFGALFFYVKLPYVHKILGYSAVGCFALWPIGLAVAWLVPYLLIIGAVLLAGVVIACIVFVVKNHGSQTEMIEDLKEAFAITSKVADNVPSKEKAFEELLAKASRLNRADLKALRDRVRGELSRLVS